MGWGSSCVCVSVCVRIFYTLDSPFEKGFARLARRHSVMETRGHVAAN